MSEAISWWLLVERNEPPVADLARRIAAKRGLVPDDQCLPYPAHVIPGGSENISVIPLHDLCPVWSAFIGVARLALETRDEKAIDDLGIPMVTFTDPATRDDKWRAERGLDHGEES